MNCGAVSGACSGRGSGPHLSQNLWGLGVMSPLSLLFRAWRHPAVDSASSWQGGGGVASTLPCLWGRTRSSPGASARCRLRLFADGVPPAPRGCASALRAPRRAIVGRGCPACPWAQQCLTPLPTAAHNAHCLCWWAAQTQRRGNHGLYSGRLATAHLCGGVKSAALSLHAGSAGMSASSVTQYCGPRRVPGGRTGPA